MPSLLKKNTKNIYKAKNRELSMYTGNRDRTAYRGQDRDLTAYRGQDRDLTAYRGHDLTAYQGQYNEPYRAETSVLSGTELEWQLRKSQSIGRGRRIKEFPVADVDWLFRPERIPWTIPYDWQTYYAILLLLTVGITGIVILFSIAIMVYCYIKQAERRILGDFYCTPC